MCNSPNWVQRTAADANGYHTDIVSRGVTLRIWDGDSSTASYVLGILNSHDELVAALREIVSQCDQGDGGGKVFGRDARITRARVALAKVSA